jgi:thiol-disulfide isomerase/thioredoxin
MGLTGLTGPVAQQAARRSRAGVRRTGGPLVALVATLLLAAGCTGPSLSSGGEQGFVTSDGSVSVLEPAERKPPRGEVAGETVDGEPVALADYAGDVVVMPVWGSWCGPCIAEAPMLADAARDLSDDGVSFLGINNRDYDQASARRFSENFDLPYPSLYDPEGNLLLNFRGTLPPLAVPTTVVIDAEGRVAARIIGELKASTLYGVVEDVLGQELKGSSGPADAGGEPEEPGERSEDGA